MDKSSGFSSIIILGAGAIGSYYGAILSQSCNVLLVGRRKHTEAIRKKGLIVTGSINQTFHPEISTGIVDVPENCLIIVTTKAFDTEEAINGIKRLLRPDTTVLVLQNGLGNEEVVRGLVDLRVSVVRGLTSTGVEFLAPGRIDVKLLTETILPATSSGVRIQTVFKSCGLEVRLTDRMEYEVWRKLAMNCVINPLSALFRVPDRDIAADSLRNVRKGIVEECISVAEREGVTLEPSLVDEITAAAAVYSNVSSMCQDILRGRRTEIGFLNGMVVKLGKRHGIPTPVYEVITDLIRFIEGKEWT
jgi:2-dehydropantoate 2-reductase